MPAAVWSSLQPLCFMAGYCSGLLRAPAPQNQSAGWFGELEELHWVKSRGGGGCRCHLCAQGALDGSQQAVGHHPPQKMLWIAVSKDATAQSKQGCDPGGRSGKGSPSAPSNFLLQKGKTLGSWVFCLSFWSWRTLRDVFPSWQAVAPPAPSLMGLGLKYEFPISDGFVHLLGV